MNLTPKQKSFLRSQAHQLNPVVMTGSAGLSESVLNEIEQALAHHELIKIKLAGADRDVRRQMGEQICSHTSAAEVQYIGQMLVIYRPAQKPRITLP